jgi:hypothetical protein
MERNIFKNKTGSEELYVRSQDKTTWSMDAYSSFVLDDNAE